MRALLIAEIDLTIAKLVEAQASPRMLALHRKIINKFARQRATLSKKFAVEIEGVLTYMGTMAEHSFNRHQELYQGWQPEVQESLREAAGEFDAELVRKIMEELDVNGQLSPLVKTKYEAFYQEVFKETHNTVKSSLGLSSVLDGGTLEISNTGRLIITYSETIIDAGGRGSHVVSSQVIASRVGNKMVIDSIVVHPEMQGKGIGQALIQTVLSKSDVPVTVGTRHLSDAGKGVFNSLKNKGLFGLSAEGEYTSVSGVGSRIGLVFNYPDAAARKVISEGGKRAGLLDLSAGTKHKMFQIIKDGRADGLGPDALARLFRDEIPAGPWSSTQIRADIIAKTETKFAQNVSAIDNYKASGVITGLMAYDNLIGYDDEDCMARDGQVFSFDDAELETADEHPNGTLTWAPYTEEF